MIQSGCFTSEESVFQPGSEFQTPRCAEGPAWSPKDQRAACLMVFRTRITWAHSSDVPSMAGHGEQQLGMVLAWLFPLLIPPNPPSLHKSPSNRGFTLRGQSSLGLPADAPWCWQGWSAWQGVSTHIPRRTQLVLLCGPWFQVWGGRLPPLVLLSPSCPAVMSCQDCEAGRGAPGPDEMIQQRVHFISNLTLNFNSLKDKKPRDIRCNEIKQSFSDSKFDHKWALRLLL